jgi:hypothetical protein
MDNKPIVENVKECPYCQGIVDRYVHHIECRNCHAYGDLMTFIMNRPDSYYLEELKNIDNDSRTTDTSS